MEAAELGELVGSLERLPVAALLTDLRSRTIFAVNDRVAAAVGAPVGELVGDDVLAHIDPRDRDAARAAAAALADRVIDGYQVRRRLLTRDGTPLTIDVWGRRVEVSPAQYGLWILIVGDRFNDLEGLIVGATSIVLAVTDHDWQIQYVNADADLLGAHGCDLRGFPILGLVHPSAAAEFLAAESRATIDQVTVTVLLRMRAGHGRWADRYCVITRLCEHEPPRLGLVISDGPSHDPNLLSAARLDNQVRHCAVEARGAHTLDTLPALVQLPNGHELSARQTEIVARLVSGQQTADIARAMFLSPSTIRNHLTATYRKFDVHSQAQLLATLLRSRENGDQWRPEVSLARAAAKLN